jgi:hypothetical protein
MTPLDRFARALAEFVRRRAVVQGLFGLSLAALATGAEHDGTDVVAKKNKKKKRRKRKKKKKNKCKPDCTGKTCGANGCGGTCGSCAGTETCLAGACANICDVCATGCTFNSISQAIAQALPGATIVLCPETFTGLAGVGVNDQVTLVGAGADPSETVLDRAGPGPTFSVQGGSTVTVRNLTITGSEGGAFGGILNSGTLTLEAVHVVDNTGTQVGGGISNQIGGELTLIDSLVQGNEAPSGGGIKNDGGTVTLIRTVVEGNEAVDGGGIDNAQGTVNLTDDSSVTGNTATGGAGSGGGILNAGTVTIDGSSSVEGNTPDDCVNDGSGTGCPS